MRSKNPIGIKVEVDRRQSRLLKYVCPVNADRLI
jgi:hypothetical protein